MSSSQKRRELSLSPNLMNNPAEESTIFEAVPSWSPAGDGHKPRLKRTNSTSSLFVKSSIGTPDVDEIVVCMAKTLFWQIKQSELQLDTGFNEVFSAQDKHAPFPQLDSILLYLRTIWKSQNLSGECGVMATAYLDRLITITGIQIRPGNWRKVSLAAIMLSSKVWEDCAVWNEDFLGVLAGEFTIKDLNSFEYHMLQCLQFAVTLKSSVYTKYYFNLRSVCQNESQFAVKPLTEEEAQKLKIRSRKFETEMKAKSSSTSLSLPTAVAPRTSKERKQNMVKSESHVSYVKTSPPVILS